MKKIKYINSILVGSLLVTPTVTVLASCSKAINDHITLEYGDKEILYTNKTKSVSLIFKTSDVKDIDDLKVKVCDLTVSGAEVKTVAGLLTTRKDSAGNIAVIVHVSVFRAQWPDGDIKFNIRFSSKTTGLDQVIEGFSFSAVDNVEEYTMSLDAFDVMASKEHDVKAGNVYAYTCKFPLSFISSRYKWFSFIKTSTTNEGEEAEFVPIDYININKNGEALLESIDYNITSDKIIELTDAPELDDEYIFEVVFLEDGHGKMVNAARQSVLDVSGTKVKGFRSSATEELILEEFRDAGSTENPDTSRCLTFYSHITEIGENAFNRVAKTPVIPQIYDEISFEKSVGAVTIDYNAFSENTYIKNLYLPLTSITGGYIKEVGDAAFAYCTGLVSDLDFVDGLKTVGTCAFQHCSSVTSLTIPASVENIGIGAFANMDALKEIDFTAWDSVPSFEKSAIFKDSGISGAKIILNEEQFTSHITEWTTWLTSQSIDFNKWTIVKEGE